MPQRWNSIYEIHLREGEKKLVKGCTGNVEEISLRRKSWKRNREKRNRERERERSTSTSTDLRLAKPRNKFEINLNKSEFKGKPSDIYVRSFVPETTVKS